MYSFSLFIFMRCRLSRYVWEIVLGAHQAFAQEESLVTLNIEEGMTCDVIGDVHGLSCCKRPPCP